jgi:uncharacterized protein YkuJ
MGKVKGGTNECCNVRSLQYSKQHALCKMAYSMKEHEFTVKTFCDRAKTIFEEIQYATGTSKISNQPSVKEV